MALKRQGKFDRRRPSTRELGEKLNEAQTVLSTTAGLFADPTKAVGELNDLELADVWPLIRKILCEIAPCDYVGAHPPVKSYEKKIEGLDLFAFAWMSRILKKKMYLKFVLKKQKFYLVSIHKDRPERLI